MKEYYDLKIWREKWIVERSDGQRPRDKPTERQTDRRQTDNNKLPDDLW